MKPTENNFFFAGSFFLYRMTVFNSDLDNTLIFSCKHDIGNDKINVELYEGREISFTTETTRKLLEEIKEKILFVPTTTRSMEQYRRINLGIGNIEYALVCNGGILLHDNKINEKWYEESLKLIEPSKYEMQKGYGILLQEPLRKFELRYISDLFIFTKCNESVKVVENLKSKLDSNYVNVYSNGEKVYIIPKRLDKGTAVKRFKKFVGADFTITAGDSEFDIPMLAAADRGIVPKDFIKKYYGKENLKPENIIEQSDNGKCFSEFVLENILAT